MNQQVLDAPMSEVTVPESVKSAWSGQSGFDDFDYTPVSPWGPVSLVLGISSLTGFLGLWGLGLAAVGILIGLAAVIRIWSDRAVVRGMWFAVIGLLLSTSSLTFGSMKMVHDYRTECPPGYLRVNFPNEISKHEFAYYGGARRLAPPVAPLIGKKLFLKGYMWQTQMSEGLREFVFLKDNGECCFGGEPKPFDMMLVRMADNKTTPAFSGMVAVGGTLNANVNAPEGKAVYTVDADFVEEARTSF